MTDLRLRTVASVATIALLAMGAAPAFAQSYPGGPEAGRDYSSDQDDRPVYQEPDQSQSSQESYDDRQDDDEGQYSSQGQYAPNQTRDSQYVEVPSGQGQSAQRQYDQGETGQQSYDQGQYEDRPYDQSRGGQPSNADRPRDGYDNAVDVCRDELTRGGQRVDSVDEARRRSGRYSVAGKLVDGRGYACSVDDEGRIRSIAVDGRAMF